MGKRSEPTNMRRCQEKKEGQSPYESMCRVRNIIAGCLAVAQFLEIDVHGDTSMDELSVVKRWAEEDRGNVISDTGRLLQRQLKEALDLSCELQDVLDSTGAK